MQDSSGISRLSCLGEGVDNGDQKYLPPMTIKTHSPRWGNTDMVGKSWFFKLRSETLIFATSKNKAEMTLFCSEKQNKAAAEQQNTTPFAAFFVASSKTETLYDR